MDRQAFRFARAALIVAVLAAAGGAAPASAAISGITGTTFNFTARDGFLANPDGSYIYFWGLADDGGTGEVQLPGPTLILSQGTMVTINLTNMLPEPVSLVFPGQEGPTQPVYDANGRLRSLAQEAAPSGGTRTYTFTAGAPGTYYYQSGTHLDKQIPLGLYGAIIVRPPIAGQAYADAATAYDREYLLLLADLDHRLSTAAESGLSFDSTDWIAGYWFINGRSATDTMSEDNVPWLPNQPYGAMVSMHPGETILLRVLNMGRDPHPFHTHGNHVLAVGRDGRLLSTGGAAGADLAEFHFTVPAGSGQTWDGLFTWSADNLGWDVYGHAPGDPMQVGEYAPDHGKAIPTQTPYLTSLQYGDLYSGSPLLGQTGPLPPDHPGLNQTGAFFYMWHSHRENEMTNLNDFPGGMMTMLAIEAPWVPIP